MSTRPWRAIANMPSPCGDCSSSALFLGKARRQPLASQRGPDLAGFLACEGGDHVDAERRPGDGLVDRGLELALEPERVFGGGHVLLSLDRQSRRGEGPRLPAKR